MLTIETALCIFDAFCAGQMRWQAKIKNKKIESEMKDLSKAADFSTCFLTSLQANLCIKPMAGYYVRY